MSKAKRRRRKPKRKSKSRTKNIGVIQPLTIEIKKPNMTYRKVDPQPSVLSKQISDVIVERAQGPLVPKEPLTSQEDNEHHRHNIAHDKTDCSTKLMTESSNSHEQILQSVPSPRRSLKSPTSSSPKWTREARQQQPRAAAQLAQVNA